MKQHAPATERNRDPILEVLRRVLPDSGTLLEIAAGTGQHAVYFSRAFPGLTWQPTDPSEDARASIDAWREDEGPANLQRALHLNVMEEGWPVDDVAAILAVNMVHISPWEATIGLLAGARRRLPSGGPLVLYGPYRIDGRPTAPSNEAFDQSLKSRDPRWGLRRLADVEAAATGFTLEEVVDMPANNVTVIFRRSGETTDG